MRWIMNRDVFCTDGLQNDEVIEVPVKNAWGSKLNELFESELECAGAEIESMCNLHDTCETDTFQRDGELATQRGEVDVMAIVTGYHRETGESAFGRFRLQNDR
ncbi:hypothetical protein DM40_640 [Burkholderia cenocepacia]|nr:hypothetical protein DM40_640 [Burkholderia cenocepacia]